MAPQNPQPRPPSTTTTKYGRDNRKAGSIAAGVIIGVLILLALAIFLWYRKTRQSTENHESPGGRRGTLTLSGLHGHTQHRSRYRKRRRHYHHTQISRHELKHLGRHSGGEGGDDPGCCFGHSDPPKDPGRIVVAQAAVYPRAPEPARVAAWRPQTHLHHHIHDVRHHGRAPAPAPTVAPAAQQPPPPNREIVLTERVRERRRARSRSRSVRPKRGRSRTPPPREPVQMNYHQGPVNIVQQQGQPAVVQMVPEQREVLEMMPEQQVRELMPEQPPPPEAPPQVYGRFVAQPPEPVLGEERLFQGPPAGERRLFQGPPPPGVRVPAAEQRPIIAPAPADILGQPQRRPPSPPPAPPQPLPARLPGNQVPLNLRAPMPAVLPAAQDPAHLGGSDLTPSTPPSSSASSTLASTSCGSYPYSPTTDTWIPPPWIPELAYPQLSIPSRASSLVPALWHVDDTRSPSPSTAAGTSYPALPHPGNLVDFAARTGDPAPRKRAWGERRRDLLSDTVSTGSSASGERRGRQVRRRGWPALVPRKEEEVMSDLMVFSREGTVKGEELAAVREEEKVVVDRGGGREGERRMPNLPEGERLQNIMRGITERLEQQREEKAERTRAGERAEALRTADGAAKEVGKEAAKEVRKEAAKEVRKEAAKEVVNEAARKTAKEAPKEAVRNGVQAVGNRALWPTVESVTDEMDAGRRQQ